MNEPSWDIRFRLRIEGENIKLETKPSYIPPPLSVIPGVVLSVNGEDLAGYFEYDNLNTSGISYQTLSQNGRLPDGFYTFCVEVIDYKSGRLISNSGCVSAYIVQSDAPVIQLPICGSVVKPNDPQLITFRWQLFSGSSGAINTHTEYILELYEITNPEGDPLSAIQNSQALKIFESDRLNTTSFIYDIQAPQLDVGKRYAFQITSKDPDGKDIFKNKGVSQVCWFYYGYPNKGNVELKYPANNGAFSKYDDRIFGWKPPSNILNGQFVKYELKIIKLDSGEDASVVFDDREPWYKVTTNISIFSKDEELMVPNPFEQQTNYAWQIIAYTNEQEIAKSEIRVFRGPGAVEFFYAGKHRVKVLTTYNDNLDNLSGKGRIAIDEDSQYVDVEFKLLKIVNINGVFTLKSGDIESGLRKNLPVKMKPLMEKNGQAVFFATNIKLNATNLMLKGYIEWKIPHAVKSAIAPLVSKSKWFNYNNLKISGSAPLEKNMFFDLLEPTGYFLNVSENSEFICTDNFYDAKFNGSITFKTMPSKRDEMGRTYRIPFYNQNQLLYMDNIKLKSDTNFLFIQATNIEIIPKNITIDLSEETSPANLSGDVRWKGVYLNSFMLKLPANITKTRQFLLPEDLFVEFNSDKVGYTYVYTNRWGLNLRFNKKFIQSKPVSKFNTFRSRISEISLFCDDGRFNNSFIKGEVNIPFISVYEWHEFLMKIEDNGLENGDLTSVLEGKTITLAGESQTKKSVLTIKKSHFTDNDKMILAIDCEFPYLNLRTGEVPNIQLWGNGNIGFNKPNDTRALTYMPAGRIENKLNIFADSLMFFYQPSKFDVSFRILPPIYGIKISYNFPVDMNSQITSFQTTSIIRLFELLDRKFGGGISISQHIAGNMYQETENERINISPNPVVSQIISDYLSDRYLIDRKLMKQIMQQNTTSAGKGVNANLPIPYNIKSIAFKDGVKLSWKCDNNKMIKGYAIYRSVTNDSNSYILINKELIAENTYYDNIPPTTQNTFFYRIAGVDENGSKSHYSQFVKTKLPDLSKPQKPDIDLISYMNNEVVIAFKKAADNDVKEYELYKSDNNKKYQKINPSGSRTRNDRIMFTDKNVEEKKTYYYYIRTIDSADNASDLSDVNDINIPSRNLALRTPRKIKINFDERKIELTISWSYTGSNDEGFVVYRKSSNGVLTPVTSLIKEMKYVDTDIINGGTYNYEIRVYAPDGRSSRSDQVEERVHYK